ncbi:DUF4865 family protein [Streptomyces sp. V3I7]|uniref:DUF4865 family protein n=1 Tax=Streptomyces sp. V3I7 TaxID=3042278 RepID=UPI00278AC251|nr:DUF4865 family protein [Streptomyces sp. V3I7]MDQ0989215.1 hypothetical protein [Streptomyces sp. V3I7]
MHALQYELVLPADYDMGIVRERVRSRGHLLDDWDGMGVKAYLIRERGVLGSPVNTYAPFYLWNTTEGMNRFLWGGPFQGIVDDFGRPEVRQWSGLAYEEGVAANAPAAVAVRRREPVPEDVELSVLMEEAVRETERLAARDGAVLAAAAVDTRRWELVHFSLWEQGAPKAEGDVFRVLHLSAPGRESLRRGRQW